MMVESLLAVPNYDRIIQPAHVLVGEVLSSKRTDKEARCLNGTRLCHEPKRRWSKPTGSVQDG